MRRAQDDRRSKVRYLGHVASRCRYVARSYLLNERGDFSVSG